MEKLKYCIPVGGGAPVRVESMLKTPLSDREACRAQCESLLREGSPKSAIAARQRILIGSVKFQDPSEAGADEIYHGVGKKSSQKIQGRFLKADQNLGFVFGNQHFQHFFPLGRVIKGIDRITVIPPSSFLL